MSDFKNILLVIDTNVFYRSLITTGLHKKLCNTYKNVSIMMNSSINYKDADLNDCNVKFYSYPSILEERHYQFLKVLNWKYRHASKTFKFRFKRISRLKPLSSLEGHLASRLKLYFKYNARSLIRRFKIILLANKLMFHFTAIVYEKFLLKHPKVLEDLIASLNPSLIIFPSSAYDPIGQDLIQISKKQNRKILYLIDNWDNLSSKSILYNLPDFIAVWGDQSVMHAKRIQKFSTNRIFKIGTPRFDHYFDVRDSELSSNYDFPYVLYVGTNLMTDERSHLEEISMIIQDRELFPENTRLVYRPHPWGERDHFIPINDLENVVYDKQLISIIDNSSSRLQFIPDINYYPSLISNAILIYGGLTSMLIESAIFYKNFIAIIHNEHENFTSPRAIYENYEHFEGIDSLPSVYFSKERGSLKKLTKAAMNSINKDNFQRQEIDDARNYFLYHDEKKYYVRLHNLIDRILINEASN